MATSSSSSLPSKETTSKNDSNTSDGDLAQAFKDLQRGEKTAEVLESNLTSLEKKIDALLASFEAEGSGKVDGSDDQVKKDGEDSKQQS